MRSNFTVLLRRLYLFSFNLQLIYGYPPVSRTVVFFLSNFKSGGTEWFALRLARGLVKRGFNPVFLVVRIDGELLPLVEKEAFEVVPLHGGGYHLLGVLMALPALVRFLRQGRADVLISGLPLLNITLALAAWASRTKAKLIMVEHMRLQVGGDLRQKIKNGLLGRVYRWADDVVAVSKTVAEDLSLATGFPFSRIHIISNPVIPENFSALRCEPLTHPWLKDKQAPVLLAVSRLLRVKDLPTLLRAFADVRKVRDARLLIVGEGGERAALQKLIDDLGLEDSVQLSGTIVNVFNLMCAADLFVLSSTSEAFGNVLVEALACGLPVVSTDCGGPREILENGRLGELVPPQSPQKLAAALLKALDASPDKEILKEKGLSFSVERSVENYVRLIENAKPISEREKSS